MKNLKKIFLLLPEYLLSAAVIFYWASAGKAINFIAIGLLIALILQIIFKNKFVGILIASLLIILSIYMLLAVMSEFNEFPTFNSDAKTLLFFGLSFFISIIAISGIMVYKYGASDSEDEQQIEQHN